MPVSEPLVWQSPHIREGPANISRMQIYIANLPPCSVNCTMCTYFKCNIHSEQLIKCFNIDARYGGLFSLLSNLRAKFLNKARPLCDLINLNTILAQEYVAGKASTGRHVTSDLLNTGRFYMAPVLRIRIRDPGLGAF